MTGPERREHPRTTLQTFAYINLGANNYGSVLNISETGLSFRSVAPVQRNRTIRFWFSEHSHRIEAIGEVAWTDETQKTGGLRFTTLSAEAREQIRHWISNPTPPPVVQDPSVLSGPVVANSPFLSTGRTQPIAVSNPSTPDLAAAKKLKVKVQLNGFSGGLAMGLMIAALVAAGYVFQNYRRQFGESLIRMGERFAARPQVQTPVTEPAPTQAAQPAPSLSPAPRTVVPPPAPIPAAAIERTDKSEPKPSSVPPPSQTAKLESAALTTSAPTPAPTTTPVVTNDSVAKNVVSASTPAVAAPPPAIALPKGSGVAASTLVSTKVDVAPPVQPAPVPPSAAEAAREVTEVSGSSGKAGPPPEMYFEVGKFKDQSGAHKATDQLSQLGFPASVHQKARLWSNSYLVLVGPFADEQKAAVASQDLLARDFRPRPFERGSRDIIFRKGVSLNGTHMPEGDCTVSWESYITDTVVKISQDHLLVTTASGKWVKSDVKYRRDAFVFRRNPDGSRTLLEIQFGGLAKTLVFSRPS